MGKGGRAGRRERERELTLLILYHYLPLPFAMFVFIEYKLLIWHLAALSVGT